MLTFVVAFCFAAAVSALATPIVRRLARRWGAVDVPSGRRVHRDVIPRMGGLAILLGFFAPLVALFPYDNAVAQVFRGHLAPALGLLGGSALMALLGAADDLTGLSPSRKLAVQIVGAVIAFAAGFRIDAVQLPWIGNLQMGMFALPVTVLWIVGIVNAVNLIDGLDGLAGGVAFLACVVNFIVGVVSGSIFVSLVAAALGGALIGFLIYNFNPATIFMGDSGSMFIGFALATTSLTGAAAKATTAISLLVPILAMGLPIMDTLLAIVRRWLLGQPLFAADRGHIHHRLLALGLTQRRAVLFLYGASLMFTSAAILVYVGRDWQIAVALGASTIATVGIVRGLRLVPASLQGRAPHGFDGADADSFRRALSDYVRRAIDTPDAAGAVAALQSFAETARMLYVRCDGLDVPGVGSWSWESGEQESRRGWPISADFPLQVGMRPAGTIRFGWRAEAPGPSPQAWTMLRVTVDAFERRLSELAGEPWHTRGPQP